MRFPATIKPQSSPRNGAVTELVRRIVVAKPLPRPEPPVSRSSELPIDLDQRVRLVGEW
jgi:hypothetical protein